MKRQCAHLGAPSLTCRSILKYVVVFRMNDLSALMLTLGVADFSPPHQSSAVSAQAYLRKTPRIIPYFPPTKNPRRKSAGVLHQSTNKHLRLGRVHYHLLTGWNMNLLINRQAKPCMIAKPTIKTSRSRFRNNLLIHAIVRCQVLLLHANDQPVATSCHIQR